jgi:hypothetical protein
LTTACVFSNLITLQMKRQYIHHSRHENARYSWPTLVTKPFSLLCKEWETVHRLPTEEDAKRELVMRTLALFPQPKFCMSVAEFNAHYVRDVGKPGDDSRRALLCMVEEKLVCFSDTHGELVRGREAIDRLSHSHTRGMLWLTAVGVKAWAQQVTDRHKQTVQGDHTISAELTDKLVGLNYTALKPKQKRHEEAETDTGEGLSRQIPQDAKAPVLSAPRPEVGVRRYGDASPCSVEAKGHDEQRAQPVRVETGGAVPSPVITKA